MHNSLPPAHNDNYLHKTTNNAAHNPPSLYRKVATFARKTNGFGGKYFFYFFSKKRR